MKQKRLLPFQRLTLQNKPTLSWLKAKLTSVSDGALLGFATDATIQVMKAELLIKDQTSYDDQASQLDYILAGTMKPIQQISTKRRSLGLPLVA